MKTPNKIRLESLTEINGLYCWAEKPFTGIAFEALPNKELASIAIEHGKVTGNKNYVPAYFECPEDLPQLDISDYVLNDTYGSGSYYITHHEQPFTGLAFDFDPDTGWCYSEYFYVNGGEAYSSDTGYYEDDTGVLIWLSLGSSALENRPFYENYRWFPDEHVKRIEVFNVEIKQSFCDISFVESGEVCRFDLGKSFSEEMTAQLFYWPFKNTLREMVFAPETTLADTEVDNDLVRFFIENGSFRQVKKLRFYKTSVTPELAHSLTASHGLEVEYIPREEKKHNPRSSSLADRFCDLFRSKK